MWLAAVAAVAFLVATGCMGPGTPGANDMLQRINAQRAAAGVGPVALCGSLFRIAQAHSEDQSRMGRISHTGSNGSTLASRAAAGGYRGWTALGENVARGQLNVAEVMGAWMASPGHRANIVNPGFSHVGFGLGNGHVWTQEFGASGSC